MPTTRVHDLDLYFDTFGDPTHDTVLLVSGLLLHLLESERLSAAEIDHLRKSLKKKSS